jgi:hypothetical protein
MSEGEDVCFCCLEEIKGETRSAVLPCCGKTYCVSCAERDDMVSFIEERGCPLCRKTNLLIVMIEIGHFENNSFFPPQIVLKKDSDVETYVISDRCLRYLTNNFLRTCHRGMALIGERCERASEEVDRVEAEIRQLRFDYAQDSGNAACDYLAHHAAKLYRRDRMPPILKHFAAHTPQSPTWRTVPVKIFHAMFRVISFNKLAEGARLIREHTGRHEITLEDILRHIMRRGTVLYPDIRF